MLSYSILSASAAALFAMRGRDAHFLPSIGVAIYSIAYGMAFACAAGYCAPLGFTSNSGQRPAPD